MVQKELVDYIKSQQALGASHDSIKNALVGAGWSAQDVDDSIVSISGGAPASASPSPATISVRDFGAGIGEKKTYAGGNLTKNDFAKVPDDMTLAHPAHPAHHLHIGYVILSVIAAALAAIAALLYFKYNSLQGQVAAMNGELAVAGSQVANLTNQLNSSTQSVASLQAQVGVLTKSNRELAGELSFFITPASATSGIAATLSGTLSSTTKGFSLLTADGLKVTVINWADAGLRSVLEPLVGATVEFSGIHAANSRELTVSSVNGNPIPTIAPAPPSSSTTQATSTAKTTSTAP